MNNSLYDLMIQHIEDNKVKHDIDYKDSIEYLKELVDTIENEYKEMGLIDNE